MYNGRGSSTTHQVHTALRVRIHHVSVPMACRMWTLRCTDTAVWDPGGFVLLCYCAWMYEPHHLHQVVSPAQAAYLCP